MKLRRTLGALAVAGVVVAQAAIPAGAAPRSDAPFRFDNWWNHWDRPVQAFKTDRSWTWGAPVAGAPTVEPYAEGAREFYDDSGHIQRVEGEREVAYYDKARMEYWPDREGVSPDDDPWQVTTGLLATELMTGRLQLGDDAFEQHQPSEVPVAGDPDSGYITPSYADMGRVMGYEGVPEGWMVIQTIDQHGVVGADQRFAAYGVTAEDVGAPTGHTVASVFWAWMNQTGVLYDTRSIDVVGDRDRFYAGRVFPNPFYATGYPTTEAYWTRARVAGVEQDVLVQCFERRCMTYTPDNAEPWRVEMANIGQHYAHWRYVEIPAEQPSDGDSGGDVTPTPTPEPSPTATPEATPAATPAQ